MPLERLVAEIGGSFGPSEPVVVDQRMIDRFAEVTGDFQWVHVDRERASRELEGTLAHGYLILSLIPHFVSRLLTITGVDRGVNYGLEKVRFPRPLRAGSFATGSLRIADARPRGAGTLLVSEMTIAEPGQERPVCVAETLTLLYPGDGELGPFGDRHG